MQIKNQSVNKNINRPIIKNNFYLYPILAVSLLLISCSYKTERGQSDKLINQPISVQISILPDLTNKYSLEEVILRDSEFTPMKGTFVESGFDPETLWLKVNIHNSSAEKRIQKIILMNGAINYAEFHEKKDGRWEKILSGYELEPVYDSQ